MKNGEIQLLESILKKWQNIIDLIVRVAGVKVGLIMRVVDQEIEVFVASNTPDNPYSIGDRQPWCNSGLYCENVIKTQEKLIIENALNSPQWCNNPSLKYNLISYLGFPIRLNNSQVFGTICLLDDQEKEFSADIIKLIEKMRDLMESHLKLQQNLFFSESCQLLVQNSHQEIKELKQQLEDDLLQKNLELEELTQRLTLALKSGKMGCWEWDIRENSIIWDERMYEIYGLTPSTIKFDTFKTWEKTLHRDDYSQTLNFLEEIIKDREKNTFSLYFRIHRADGQIRHIQSYGFVLRSDQGEALKMIGLNTDITEFKQKEEQLKHLNEQLLKSVNLKNAFLATISHELRTPLTAILGMIEVLNEEIYGELNQKQLKAVTTIQRSANKLLELINDLLDLAHSQSGELILHYQETNISSLCQSIIEFIKPQIEKKAMQFYVNIPPNLPSLFIDPKYIRQVLIHLLNNAIKFTPFGGTITLKVTPHKQVIPVEPAPLQGITKVRIYRTPWEKKVGQTINEENLIVKHYLRFSIQDTGIGISSKYIATLFEPFNQLDNTLNRKYEGTGLGLALIKQVVDLHGGEINVSSQFGVGSCFTVDLPVDRRGAVSPPLPQGAVSPPLPQGAVSPPLPQGAVSPPPQNVVSPSPEGDRPVSPSPEGDRPVSPSPEGDRHVFPSPEGDRSQNMVSPSKIPLILLVEDNPANVMTMESYLEAKGYRLIIAENGEEALNLVKKHHPDLILMDTQMKTMEGIIAIKKIKQDPNFSTIPIIGLTTLVNEKHQELSEEVGADQYLTKPVKLKELIKKIQELLTR